MIGRLVLPDIPEPARVVRLGGNWSPRARRFENGMIARVPPRLVRQWDKEHSDEQLAADLAYCMQRAGNPPPGSMEAMNAFFVARYSRIFKTVYENDQRRWDRIARLTAGGPIKRGQLCVYHDGKVRPAQ